MKKKSLVVSYNDLEDDIAKPYFLFKVLEESSFESIFLINNSQRKKEFLKLYKANYILLKKIQLINLFYLIIGFFVSFLPSYKIKKKYEDIAFKSFCVSARHRVGGISLISPVKLYLIKARFFLMKITTIGFLFCRISIHKNVENVVLDERHKLPESFIFYIALTNNIPVIQYTRGPYKNTIGVKKLTNSNWWHHPLSDTKAIFSKNIDDSQFPEDWEELLIQEFEKRYKENHWYDRDLTVGNKNIDSFESLFKEKKEDYALIVPHIMWDATFSYGENIFQDYLSWLIKVLELAAEVDLKFFCKLHPDLIWKSHRIEKGFDHLTFINSKIKELGASNIQILPPETNISPLSLIQNSRIVLTVRGTAGLEAACYGVPVLTGGSGRYSSFGFTVDSNSIEEFENNFKKIKEFSVLNDSQIKTARKLAYRIFFQKPLMLESINLSRDLSRDMSTEEFSKSFNPHRFNMDFNNYNFTNLFRNDEYDIYSK